MNLVKYFLTLVLLFIGYCFADTTDSSDMAKSNVSGPSAARTSNMTDGYDPTNSNFGISQRNQMFAKISYVVSLVLCASTLIFFFIARINAKKNYVKAKKFFIIGLVLFALVIATFLLPKLFLSLNFPGNFDMRAT